VQSAKVPVLKLRQRSTGLWADLIVDRLDGIQAARFVCKKIARFPALPPLVLFLKLFLLQRGLHETFQGGMGSYALVCVVLSFLQLHPSAREAGAHSQASLGHLLLDFFRYYGQEFRYGSVGISVQGRGALFDRAARGWMGTTRTGQPALCLESPLEPSVDIGAKVFKIGVVRAAFNHGYHVLGQLVLAKGAPGPSLLCPQLVHLRHPLVARRWQLLEVQPPPLLEVVGRPESDEEESASKRRRRDREAARRAALAGGSVVHDNAGGLALEGDEAPDAIEEVLDVLDVLMEQSEPQAELQKQEQEEEDEEDQAAEAEPEEGSDEEEAQLLEGGAGRLWEQAAEELPGPGRGSYRRGGLRRCR